jgi:hypothetical protein
MSVQARHGAQHLLSGHAWPGQRWYSHGNPFVHRDPRAPARYSVAQPIYALSSFPGQGCPAVRRTSLVAHVRACTMATVPALRDVEEGMGLHEGTPGTGVDGPRAHTREHEARSHPAERGIPGTTRVLAPA